MKNSVDKLKLTSFDELFGTDNLESITSATLDELYDFTDHPFKVREDEEMLELVESVKARGVLVPILVRPRKQGGFETVSGHRRKFAAKMAGLDRVPIVVRELSDDDAVIIMVDSNIQRVNILPSEKAFALAMKYNALLHQGKISEDKEGKQSGDLVGEAFGLSGRHVKRYIRLTKLIPELLELVDSKKISMVIGVEISFLKQGIQMWLLEEIKKGAKITSEKIALIKQTESVSREVVQCIVRGKTEKKAVRKVTISEKKINTYFEDSYSVEEIESIICSLLEQWKVQNRKVG